MKTNLLRNSLSLVACAAIAAFSLGSAMGQAVKVAGDKPAFDDILSPEFSGPAKQKRFVPKPWLEIETKLKISMATKSAVVERMTVKWYVAVKNPEKSGTYLLLTKDVEHVNILLDEDIYVSIYLSPVSIKRLTGSDRAGKNSVEMVGYEVLINGEKVWHETSKGSAGWWNQPSPRIARSETVPLLNKSETPFAAMWWDRYAEVSDGRGR